MRYLVVIALVSLSGMGRGAESVTPMQERARRASEALEQFKKSDPEGYARELESLRAQRQQVLRLRDLRPSGALEDLRTSDSERYERVIAFMNAAEQTACRVEQLRIVETENKATDARCMGLVKTSNPPKVDIRFNMDGIPYIATIRLVREFGRATPAEGSRLVP